MTLTTTANSAGVFIATAWGDFNNLVGKGRFRVMPVRLGWQPAVGTLIEVHDGDGNTCRGTVDETTRWGCYARMDLDTWIDG